MFLRQAFIGKVAADIRQGWHFMRVLILAFAIFLASCGGRVAQPIALESGFDDQLSCAHLVGERANNIKRLAELTGEGEDRIENNIGLLVASPLFLDFSDTLKREAEAIIARNERLTALMEEKECVGEPATSIVLEIAS